MIKKYELISEKDIRSFNSEIGKIGIIIDFDLLGSPVIYVDYRLLKESLGIKTKAKRSFISEEKKQKVRDLHMSGVNYRNIAKETEISLGSVSKIISEGH